MGKEGINRRRKMKKRKGDRDRREREGGGGALEEKDQGLWSEVNF